MEHNPHEINPQYTAGPHQITHGRTPDQATARETAEVRAKAIDIAFTWWAERWGSSQIDPYNVADDITNYIMNGEHPS